MKILLVDDEKELRSAVIQMLEIEDYSVEACADADTALTLLPSVQPHCVISDIKMPGMDGLTFLTRCIDSDPDLPVVLITGHGDVQTAIKAIRSGAYDFIEKPFRRESFLDVIRRATEKRCLVLENRRLKQKLQKQGGELLIGQSQTMKKFMALLMPLAEAGLDVLVNGETGTGKELVARSIHRNGPRGNGPFVAVNCAAIPETMMESEFFGFEAGAFTGAARRRIGKFEFANGGTLFLDEVDSIPPSLAAKILRVLQERTIERLGSNQPVKLDFQVVAATKADLRKMAEAGVFRADLYYRLNAAELYLPPLRERGDDIVLLFQQFIDSAAARFDRRPPGVDADVIAALLAHHWPGNVRELKNAADRFVLGNGRVDFSSENALSAAPAQQEHGLAARVADFEKKLIEQALKIHGGNVQKCCDALQTPRKTFYDKLKRYLIEPASFRD